MEKLQEATIFATKAHDGMRRKGNDQAYIFHPLEVLSLASMLTKDEDILCAAVLHDVVEDAGVSIDEIKERFGDNVAQIVGSESEDKRVGVPKSESWVIRKQEAIDALINSDNIGSKIVCLCDKLSNLRSFHQLQLMEGEGIWDHFNQKDPLKHYWYYDELRKALSVLSDTAIYKEYSFLVDTIFDKYKGD